MTRAPRAVEFQWFANGTGRLLQWAAVSRRSRISGAPSAAVASEWHRRRKLSLPDLCGRAGVFRPTQVSCVTAGPEPHAHTVAPNLVQLATAALATGRSVGVLSGSTLQLSGKRLGLKRLPIDLPIRPLTTGIVRLKIGRADSRPRSASSTALAMLPAARGHNIIAPLGSRRDTSLCPLLARFCQ
jgi:hypothetical protein